jgi:hypothetical protein
MPDGRAVLNNVTIYVAPGDFEQVAAFYEATLSAGVLFEQAGHIRCLDVGPERSLCIHEEEPDHAAGEVEVVFWVDDLAEFRSRAEAAGLDVGLVADACGLTDPTGRRLRFQERPAT